MAWLGDVDEDKRWCDLGDGFSSGTSAISGLVGGEDVFEATVWALLSASESDLAEAAVVDEPERARMSGAL